MSSGGHRQQLVAIVEHACFREFGAEALGGGCGSPLCHVSIFEECPHVSQFFGVPIAFQHVGGRQLVAPWFAPLSPESRVIIRPGVRGGGGIPIRANQPCRRMIRGPSAQVFGATGSTAARGVGRCDLRADRGLDPGRVRAGVCDDGHKNTAMWIRPCATIAHCSSCVVHRESCS